MDRADYNDRMGKGRTDVETAILKLLNPRQEDLSEIAEVVIKAGAPGIRTLGRACDCKWLNIRRAAPYVLGVIWEATQDKSALVALIDATRYPDADHSAFRVLLNLLRFA